MQVAELVIRGRPLHIDRMRGYTARARWRRGAEAADDDGVVVVGHCTTVAISVARGITPEGWTYSLAVPARERGRPDGMAIHQH